MAPLKEIRIKYYSEPRITAEILDSIRERDSWLHRSRNDKQKYRTLKVQNNIRSAKRHYMIDEIDENKDNPRQLWKHLKDLGYQSKSKESTNIVLDVDGKK